MPLEGVGVVADSLEDATILAVDELAWRSPLWLAAAYVNEIVTATSLAATIIRNVGASVAIFDFCKSDRRCF